MVTVGLIGATTGVLPTVHLLATDVCVVLLFRFNVLPQLETCVHEEILLASCAFCAGLIALIWSNVITEPPIL